MEPKNRLFLLLLVTASSLPLSFAQIAQPTDSLITDPKINRHLKQICNTTTDPNLCLHSYFLYTGEDHPDASVNARAVLRKELEAAKKMSLELYTKSIGFSSLHYGKDEKAYGVFDRCGRMFVLASIELIRAKEALLKFNDVEKVEVGVNEAVEHYRTCGRSFGRSVAAPPELEAAQLYKMADICLSLANSIH